MFLYSILQDLWPIGVIESLLYKKIFFLNLKQNCSMRFHFSLSCIGEGNGNPLQCSCLENPRDGGAWWAAVYGVTQGWTQLKWFSSSSSWILEEEYCQFCFVSIIHLENYKKKKKWQVVHRNRILEKKILKVKCKIKELCSLQCSSKVPCLFGSIYVLRWK